MWLYLSHGHTGQWQLGKTMKLILLAAAAAAAFVALPATAQTVCPAGSSVAIIRLSKLTPGGTMEGARQAAADHAKWYGSHGYAGDKIVFAPALSYDRASDKASLAPDQFYTFHIKATDVPNDKHDAAWASYVAEYNKNSTIVSTGLACMPD
jgi:hypothetical protein